jgi:TolB-like protein/Flp pilus assembly protein TadD
MTGAADKFGPFVFDRERMTLSRDGEVLAIGGRGAALLAALIDAGGAVVGKEALMEAAWSGTIVEEGNLAVQIAALRKAMGGDSESIIVTVPRVGYRLVAQEANTPEPEAGGRPLIAVLPFANLSSDPDQTFFADGVVEDIITALSRFRQFAVVARNSSFAYKDRAVDVRTAARELGVRYVLEGSVRRAGDRVRVTAQLIDADNGAHIWAEKFEGSTADIFDFQDRVAESVVGLLEPRIRLAEIERARRKRPDSLDAYDLYLRALPLVYSMEPADYVEALALLRRSIALDPNFALALAYAAWTTEKRLTWGLPPLGEDDQAECMRLGRAALLADPNDPIVLAITGWLSFVIEGDVETGLDVLRRAVDANPNNVVVLGLWGYANMLGGDPAAAIAIFQRALRLSPNAPDAFGSLTGIGTSYLMQGDFEAAIEWSLKSLATYNEWPMTYWTLIPAYAHLGRLAEARAAAEKLLAIAPNSRVSRIAANHGQQQRMQSMREGLLKAGMPE